MSKRSSKNTDKQREALIRKDVEKLFQQAGSSEKLDLSHQYMRGINLSRADLPDVSRKPIF